MEIWGWFNEFAKRVFSMICVWMFNFFEKGVHVFCTPVVKKRCNHQLANDISNSDGVPSLST